MLHDVLLVPEFKVNLIYVNKLMMDNNCVVKFGKSGCVIQGLSCKTLLKTDEREEGLFNTKMVNQAHAFSVSKFVNDFVMWHNRLGHAASDTVNTLLKSQNKCVSC